ncbi:hypothetical protein [Klebsiella aerogenes]|uniref:hypothetical protein n=1 Tax=Klebsiella aerogenes TaxID=548 RepID=UPI001BCC20DE|nr:hypothetical protein [Klebsiella aerogenes]
MLNIIIGKYILLIRLLLSGLAVCISTGCVTAQLKHHIRSNETARETYHDEIVGLATVKSDQNHKSWVLIGKQYDYQFITGGQEITSQLASTEINRHDISVKLNDNFHVDIDRMEFDGNIYFYYNKTNPNKETQEKLSKNGFGCTGVWQELSCANTKRVGIENGTVHEKNKIKNNGDMLLFNNPLTVRYYEKTSISPARLLYPVTIVVDMVTSPFQLFGLLILYGWP